MSGGLMAHPKKHALPPSPLPLPKQSIAKIHHYRASRTAPHTLCILSPNYCFWPSVTRDVMCPVSYGMKTSFVAPIRPLRAGPEEAIFVQSFGKLCTPTSRNPSPARTSQYLERGHVRKFGISICCYVHSFQARCRRLFIQNIAKGTLRQDRA